MSLARAKIYHDGSHFIAIPREQQRYAKPKSTYRPPPSEIDTKVRELYSNTKADSKKEKVSIVVNEINKDIQDIEKAKEIVNRNLEKMNRNLIVRKTRYVRKMHSHQWNYFCTFTYDSNKLTEEEFKKKLSNCLRHLAHRKKWKYAGVWERSPINNRLHFHGLFYIKNMVGEFIQTKDYSTKTYQMQKTTQNTYFIERFGRNDFKVVDNNDLGQAIKYLMKYIQKSGEKIVYSKHLGTYIVSDIIEEDIVCPIGNGDRKQLLFDDFYCLIDGEVIGKASPEILEKMPRVN